MLSYGFTFSIVVDSIIIPSCFFFFFPFLLLCLKVLNLPSITEDLYFWIHLWLFSFSSPRGILNSPRPYGCRNSSQASNGPADLPRRHARDANASGAHRKEVSEEKQNKGPSGDARAQMVKRNNIQAHSSTLSASNSPGGVYFSSTDPVHVPSPDSRSSAVVGAIKREVGVVGGGRQSSDNAVKDISAPSNSFSTSLMGRDNSSESFRPFPAISKADQSNQTAADSGMHGISVSRASSSNQYAGRSHQPSVGHQKGITFPRFFFILTINFTYKFT